MSKNEDSAFVMNGLLEARVGKVITVYLEGGTKLTDVILIQCERSEVILRGKREKLHTPVIHTTPDRIVAFEDSELNQPKKPEEDDEDDYDPLSDTITPRKKETSPDDDPEDPEDPEGK